VCDLLRGIIQYEQVCLFVSVRLCVFVCAHKCLFFLDKDLVLLLNENAVGKVDTLIKQPESLTRCQENKHNMRVNERKP